MFIKNDKHEFLCPECGSTQPNMAMMISPIENPDEPWSEVLHAIFCAECHFAIPAHVAECWDGLSPEHARGEWQRLYREGSWREGEDEEDLSEDLPD